MRQLAILSLLVTLGACAAQTTTTRIKPAPFSEWESLTIYETVPGEVKVCVVGAPPVSAAHPLTCITVRELRLLLRGKSGS